MESPFLVDLPPRSRVASFPIRLYLRVPSNGVPQDIGAKFRVEAQPVMVFLVALQPIVTSRVVRSLKGRRNAY